jgi:hypothetical protein
VRTRPWCGLDPGGLDVGIDQTLVQTKVESVLRVVASFHVDPLEVTTIFWYGLDFGMAQALV